MLLAIDGSNLIHRAWFASPKGFMTLFTTWVGNLQKRYDPTVMEVCVDSATCFRRDLDPNYKQGRAEKDSMLAAWLDAHRKTWPSPEGYEADDLIATLVHRHGGPAVIVSGDLDLAALVTHDVSLVRPPDWWKRMTPDDVYEKVGVWPDQVAAYKSLAGDTSDKIKGVEGFGPVKARKLLETYGTFEGVLVTLTPAQQEQARAAHELVRLREDAPLP